MASQPWREAKQRRTRAAASPFVAALTAALPPGTDYLIGGSWRRGAPDIGDLDILITTPTGRFGDFRFPPCFTAQHQGEQVTQGDLLLPGGDSMHCDMWVCSPAQRGAFTCFITGPANLNIRQRAWAQKLGFTLSQYGLFAANGSQLDTGSEESVYSRLGLPYLTPEQRQRYAQASPPADATSETVRITSPDSGHMYPVTVTTAPAPPGADPDARVRFYRCPCLGYKYNRDTPKTCKHCHLLGGPAPSLRRGIVSRAEIARLTRNQP